MKTTLLFICIFVGLCTQGISQNSESIYMICKAIDNSGQKRPDKSVVAVYRYHDPENNRNPLYTEAPIYFDMVFKSKGIDIEFLYMNYNLDELKKTRAPKPKDTMIRLHKDKSFLASAEMQNAIVLEDVLKTFQTKEEAWEWAERFKGKRIYLYDAAEGPDDNGQIVLYQIRMRSSGRPATGITIEYL